MVNANFKPLQNLFLTFLECVFWTSSLNYGNNLRTIRPRANYSGRVALGLTYNLLISLLVILETRLTFNPIKLYNKNRVLLSTFSPNSFSILTQIHRFTEKQLLKLHFLRENLKFDQVQKWLFSGRVNHSPNMQFSQEIYQ